MLIIPAIDLKNGRCVRLTEGRKETERVYEGEPVEVAQGYQRAGAEMLHVVDLDAAFGNVSGNRGIIRDIAAATSLPVEAGGGVRALGDVEYLIEKVGVRYVVVGTMAVENHRALTQAVKMFGDSIVVGIDARENEVAVRGWNDTAPVDALTLARRIADTGVRRIIYTDITRDGRLEGPNLEMTKRIAEASGVSVTASGGVSSLEDIDALLAIETLGVASVIIGKALYERRFTVEDAIGRARRANPGRRG